MSESNTDADRNSDVDQHSGADEHGDGPRRDAGTPDESRHAGFAVGDDGYVVYDTENSQAWIQTDASVELAEVR